MKFVSLHIEEMPSGDSLIPEDVRLAKYMRYKMSDWANLGEREDATAEDYVNEDEEGGYGYLFASVDEDIENENLVLSSHPASTNLSPSAPRRRSTTGRGITSRYEDSKHN